MKIVLVVLACTLASFVAGANPDNLYTVKISLNHPKSINGLTIPPVEIKEKSDLAKTFTDAMTQILQSFGSASPSASVDEYKKAAKEYLNMKMNPYVESQAKTAQRDMIRKDKVEYDVDISMNPKLQLLAKITKRNALYYVEMSLKEPQSIKGLNIPRVQVNEKSDLKKTFMDALTQILQSFDPTLPSLDEYKKVVKDFLRNKITLHVQNLAKIAENDLMRRDTVQYQVDVSLNPKLQLLAKVSKKNHLYSVEVSLKEPRLIVGFTLPVVSVSETSDLKSALLNGLKQFLQPFDPPACMIEKYCAAAKKYVENSGYLNAQALLFTNLIKGQMTISHLMVISIDPLFKVTWKFTEKPNLYKIEMSLHQPKAIQGLDIATVTVTKKDKSVLKNAFMDGLKQFLSSVDCTSAGQYVKLVKGIENKIQEYAQTAWSSLWGRTSIESTIVISQCPRLEIGYKLEKNRNFYSAEISLKEPKSIKGLSVPAVRVQDKSHFHKAFVNAFKQFLQPFNPTNPIIDKYAAAAKKYRENSGILDAQALLFTSWIAEQKQASHVIVISFDPLIKVLWKFAEKSNLYELEMSLAEPKALPGLDISAVKVTKKDKSDMKNAFIDSLKKLLSSFDTTTVDKYVEAAKAFRPSKIQKEARQARILLGRKNSLEHTILISESPKLMIAYKIQKNQNLYSVEISLKEPTSIKGLNVPVVQVKDRMYVQEAFVDALKQFLHSFDPSSTLIEKYAAAAKKYRENSGVLDAQAVLFTSLIAEQKRASHVILISLNPLIKVNWKFAAKHNLYEIEVSLDQPTTIPGLDIPAIKITKHNKSDMKYAFIDALKQLLSSFDSDSVDKYVDAVKRFGRPQIEKEARSAETLMGTKYSLQNTIVVSESPRLQLAYKIVKSGNLYTVKVYLKEPKSLKGLTIPVVEEKEKYDLKKAFTDALTVILKSFNPTVHSIDKYRAVAKAYREDSSYLDGKANKFVRLVGGLQRASQKIVISQDPMIKVYYKFAQEGDLYKIEMSLDEPAAIPGLTVSPIKIAITDVSKLKQAFIDTLKRLLLLFDSPAPPSTSDSVSVEKYREAVKNFGRAQMDKQTHHAMNLMGRKESAESTMVISHSPRLELSWKIKKSQNLYSVEISLKKPTSIKGLNVPVVYVREKSDLKKTFVDALEQFLQPFKPTLPSIDNYLGAVRNFDRHEIEAQTRYALSWLRNKNIVEHTIIISQSPKLAIGYKIERHLSTGVYVIKMYLAEPKKIKGLPVPEMELTARESALGTQFAGLLNEMLQAFNTVHVEG